MKTLKINHAAVWVCFILLHILGFVWYGPLFSEPWMEMVGLDLATVEANPPSAGAWITNSIATITPLYRFSLAFYKTQCELWHAVLELHCF